MTHVSSCLNTTEEQRGCVLARTFCVPEECDIQSGAQSTPTHQCYTQQVSEIKSYLYKY